MKDFFPCKKQRNNYSVKVSLICLHIHLIYIEWAKAHCWLNNSQSIDTVPFISEAKLAKLSGLLCLWLCSIGHVSCTNLLVVLVLFLSQFSANCTHCSVGACSPRATIPVTSAVVPDTQKKITSRIDKHYVTSQPSEFLFLFALTLEVYLLRII